MKISKEKLEKSLADAKQYYETAYQYYSAGKYKDSEDFFRLLTTMIPQTIEFWVGLGASLQMQHKFQEAIDTFSVAAILDVEEVNLYPHLHAAECLWALQDHSRAKVALQSAIQIAKKEQKDQTLLEKLQFLLKRWREHAI